MGECLEVTTFGACHAHKTPAKAEHGYELTRCLLLRGIDCSGGFVDSADAMLLAGTEADVRSRIDAVRGAMGRTPVAVGRARAATSTIVLGPAADERRERVSVYLEGNDRIQRKRAHVVVCELLRRNGLAAAVAYRDLHYPSRTDSRKPMVIVAIGFGTQIAAALRALHRLREWPLITVQTVSICKRDGDVVDGLRPVVSHAERGMAPWNRLTIYTESSARHQGQPLHRALLSRLHAVGVIGAVTLRGAGGFVAELSALGELQLSRQVPLVTMVVDTTAHIARTFDAVEECTARHGLVTNEALSGVPSGIWPEL